MLAPAPSQANRLGPTVVTPNRRGTWWPTAPPAHRAEPVQLCGRGRVTVPMRAPVGMVIGGIGVSELHDLGAVIARVECGKATCVELAGREWQRVHALEVVIVGNDAELGEAPGCGHDVVVE